MKIAASFVTLLIPALAASAAFAQIDQPAESTKSPVVAGICSLITPGGGQFYNGDTWKGVGFMAAGVASMAYLFAGTGGDYYDPDPIRAFPLLAVSVVSVFEAVNTAEDRREQARYGHLFELDRDRFTFGFDVASVESNPGFVFSVHY